MASTGEAQSIDPDIDIAIRTFIWTLAVVVAAVAIGLAAARSAGFPVGMNQPWQPACVKLTSSSGPCTYPQLSPDGAGGGGAQAVKR